MSLLEKLTKKDRSQLNREIKTLIKTCTKEILQEEKDKLRVKEQYQQEKQKEEDKKNFKLVEFIQQNIDDKDGKIHFDYDTITELFDDNERLKYFEVLGRIQSFINVELEKNPDL